MSDAWYDEGDIIGSVRREDESENEDKDEDEGEEDRDADDAPIIALYRQVLKQRGGGPVPLQNLTGYLSQLDPVPCGVGKSELRRLFLERPGVFRVDANQGVSLVSASKTRRRKRSRNADLPPRFASSSCRSLSSAQSNEDLREVRGVVMSVHPSFGFIQPDGKYHLGSNVFFSKESFEAPEGTFQSLQEVLDACARVVACVRPSDKAKVKAKWVATSVRLEDGDRSSSRASSLSSRCTKKDSRAQRNGNGDGESAASLELNKIERGEGVIEKVLNNFGFIRRRSDARSKANVYFRFECVKNVPPGKSVRDVVREEQAVTFDAVPTDRPGSKAKWRAVHVWISDEARANGKPSSYGEYDESEVYVSSSSSDDGDDDDEREDPESSVPWCRREKMTNEQGRIYPLSQTEAEIRFRDQREKVFAVSKVIYRDGKPVEADLMWEVDDGAAVVFDAISDPDCPASIRWKATLVSVGKVPVAVSNAADSEIMWNELIREYRNAPTVKARSTPRETEPHRPPPPPEEPPETETASNSGDRTRDADSLWEPEVPDVESERVVAETRGPSSEKSTRKRDRAAAWKASKKSAEREVRDTSNAHPPSPEPLETSSIRDWTETEPGGRCPEAKTPADVEPRDVTKMKGAVPKKQGDKRRVGTAAFEAKKTAEHEARKSNGGRHLEREGGTSPSDVFYDAVGDDTDSPTTGFEPAPRHRMNDGFAEIPKETMADQRSEEYPESEDLNALDSKRSSPLDELLDAPPTTATGFEPAPRRYKTNDRVAEIPKETTDQSTQTDIVGK